MMQVGSNGKPTTPISNLDSAEHTLPTTGRSAPLGASLEQGGLNFSVYSRDAARIDLLLFDSEDAPPSRVIHLDPSAHHTYHHWHVFVPGLQPGQLYEQSVNSCHLPRWFHLERPGFVRAQIQR